MILTLPQNYLLQVSLTNRKQAVHNLSTYLLGQQGEKTSFIRLKWVFFSFSFSFPYFWSKKNNNCFWYAWFQSWKMLKVSEAMKKVLAPGRRGGWREQRFTEGWLQNVLASSLLKLFDHTIQWKTIVVWIPFTCVFVWRQLKDLGPPGQDPRLATKKLFSHCNN